MSDRVVFLQQDLFEADLADASVITMYCLPALNMRLQPALRSLKAGTRIVSHNYDMGPAWSPRGRSSWRTASFTSGLFPGADGGIH